MSRQPPRAPANEDGFTLVEVVVVVMIVLLLGAMSVYFGRSGKRSANTATAVAVAQAYSQAVEQFAIDHAGRYPDEIGSSDWPLDDESAAAGPASPLGRSSGRYLRSVPEAVTNEQIGIGVHADGGWVEYAPSDPGSESFDYELRVVDQEGVYSCSFGSDLPDGTTPCTV